MKQKFTLEDIQKFIRHYIGKSWKGYCNDRYTAEPRLATLEDFEEGPIKLHLVARSSKGCSKDRSFFKLNGDYYNKKDSLMFKIDNESFVTSSLGLVTDYSKEWLSYLTNKTFEPLATLR